MTRTTQALRLIAPEPRRVGEAPLLQRRRRLAHPDRGQQRHWVLRTHPLALPTLQHNRLPLRTLTGNKNNTSLNTAADDPSEA